MFATAFMDHSSRTKTLVGKLSPGKHRFGYATPFTDSDQLVRLNSGKSLNQSIGPVNFQIGVIINSQPKMKPAIIHRVKARLRHDRLRLYFTAIPGEHPGPNRAAVRLCPHEKYLEPIAVPGEIVPQQ